MDIQCQVFLNFLPQSGGQIQQKYSGYILQVCGIYIWQVYGGYIGRKKTKKIFLEIIDLNFDLSKCEI